MLTLPPPIRQLSKYWSQNLRKKSKASFGVNLATLSPPYDVHYVYESSGLRHAFNVTQSHYHYGVLYKNKQERFWSSPLPSTWGRNLNLRVGLAHVPNHPTESHLTVHLSLSSGTVFQKGSEGHRRGLGASTLISAARCSHGGEE